jgi:hypothetical protein
MFQGIEAIRGAGEQIEYTKEMLAEYVKCKEDILYFAEKYFVITTIDHGKIKIPLWDFQKKVLKAFIDPPDNKKNIIMMMPRQQGKCFLSDTIVKIRNRKSGEIREIEIGKFFDLILRGA